MGLTLEGVPYDILVEALGEVDEDTLEKVCEELGYEPVKDTFTSPLLECMNCGDRIYSKYLGHYVQCSCQEIFIDVTSKDFYRASNSAIRLGMLEVEINEG